MNAILDEPADTAVPFDTKKGAKTEPGTVHVPTTRLSLSGTVVKLHEPGYTNWHGLVQRQPKTQPAERTGAFYQAMAELPTPEDLVEVLVAVPPSYRSRRASKGGYSRVLHRNLGHAWVAKRAKRRAQRAQERLRQHEARTARLNNDQLK